MLREKLLAKFLSIHEAFLAIDKNRDGNLSLDEFLEVTQACGVDGHTGSGLFGALDADHDGLLRLPDLRKAMKAAPATVTARP